MRASYTTTIIGIMLILQLAVTFSSSLQANAQHTNTGNGRGVMYSLFNGYLKKNKKCWN
jgi:hypothetical protein